MGDNYVMINITGMEHKIPRKLLLTHPDTRLGKLAKNGKFSSDTPNSRDSEPKSPDLKSDETFFFSRPYSSFEAVLGYYQTGELHMPNNVCPKSFKTELAFWEINPTAIEDCCRFKFLSFLDDFETISKFNTVLNRTYPVHDLGIQNVSLCKRLRAKVWSVLDHEDTTMIAQMFMWLMLVCVLTSILTLSLGTVQCFQIPIDSCELREFVRDLASENTNYDDVFNLLMNVKDCSKSVSELTESYLDILLSDNNETIQNYFYNEDWDYPSSEEFFETVNKLKNFAPKRKRGPVFVYLDFVLLAIFSIELVLRVVTCPSLKSYLMSCINLVDIIVLISTYIELLIEYYFPKHRYDDKGLKIFYYLQMFRVLRIIRYVQHVPSIRVLGHTFRSSHKDLSVLLLFVLIGVVLFANFAYFAEDRSHFESIPHSWWWAIITMTTVGYGDIVPKTVPGKIISSLCALSGVLVLSLSIPVFVNTFISLYQFSRIHEKFQRPAAGTDKSTTVSRVKVSPCPTVSQIIDVKALHFESIEGNNRLSGKTESQFKMS